MNDIETIRQIEDNFGVSVCVEYRPVNLGSGSDDEQESGTEYGEFNGNSTNAGRTLRYEFDTVDGNRLYLFIDEIVSIEVA